MKRLIEAVVKRLLNESTCPACGAKDAYVGATAVECPNYSCKFFTQRQSQDSGDATNDTAVLADLQKIEPVDPSIIALFLKKSSSISKLLDLYVDDFGFDRDEALQSVFDILSFSDIVIEDDVLWLHGRVGVSNWWDDATKRWLSTEDDVDEYEARFGSRSAP